MRGFTAVLQRELVERRLILAAAVLIGLFPLIMPYLPGGWGAGGKEARGGLALSMSLITSGVLSLILGGSVISRELAERRLSFYFSRPIPDLAIWAGKMAATALLVLGSGALVLLPAWLAGASLDPSGYWGNGLLRGSGWIVLGWAGLVSLLFLASHAASVIVRSRSPWLLLDLVALGLIAALVWSTSESLLLEGAVLPLFRIYSALLLALLIALLTAGLVQVARGRTDLRRGHRWLSITLWSLLLVSGLASAVYASRVLAIAPEDLEEIAFVEPAPAGNWIVLGGQTRDQGDLIPMFLVDTDSGRSVRLNAAIPAQWQQLHPEISRDGRRAAWLARQRSGFDSPAELRVLDLTRPEAVPVATPVTFALTFPDMPVDIALSPDGSRIASLRRSRLFVDEISTGRTLVSIPLPTRPGGEPTNQYLLFPGPGLVRIYLSDPPRTDIYEADLRTRKLIQTGHDERHIRDGRTGKVLATFPGSHREWTYSALLTRGRVAIPIKQKDSWDLRILAQDGSETRRFHFDGVYAVQAGPQLDPDHLVAVTWRDKSEVDQAWLLDLESGASRSLGKGLIPVSRSSSPGSPGSKLFFEGSDRLVRLDPLHGEKRVVLDLGKD